MNRTIETKTGMSVGEGLAWWAGIFCTCGLLYPIYRMRKHAADRTSKTVIAS